MTYCNQLTLSTKDVDTHLYPVPKCKPNKWMKYNANIHVMSLLKGKYITNYFVLSSN